MTIRIYHHYEKLEEFHAGMWKRPVGPTRKKFILDAADLMRSPDEFKLAMQRATEDWPISCQHNLTSLDSNRIARLGTGNWIRLCRSTGPSLERVAASVRFRG